MSVRVRESTQAQPPRRRGPRWLMVAIVIVIIAAAGVFALTYDTSSDSGDTSPGGGGQPAGASDDADKPSADLSLSTETVAFAKTGFPHSEAGAIEAATAINVALSKAAEHSDDEVTAFAEAVYPDATDTIVEAIQLGRERQGLDDDGNYPDLAPDQDYYNEALPQYGAYKVTKNSDDSYDVSTWMPVVYGPGSPDDVGDLQVLWAGTKVTMNWSDGQWRVEGEGDGLAEDYSPQDINRPDVSFQERQELLGDGWQLYEGASEEWPRDLLGPAPGEVQ